MLSSRRWSYVHLHCYSHLRFGGGLGHVQGTTAHAEGGGGGEGSGRADKNGRDSELHLGTETKLAISRRLKSVTIIICSKGVKKKKYDSGEESREREVLWHRCFAYVTITTFFAGNNNVIKPQAGDVPRG